MSERILREKLQQLSNTWRSMYLQNHNGKEECCCHFQCATHLDTFLQTEATPAQPAGELLGLANGWRKLSDKYYESGMEEGDRYKQGMSAVYATCADEVLAALGRKGE
jgi:hypothetical protein